MTERASKPSEPAAKAASPQRLETVEFEPATYDHLSAEEVARAGRGEKLPFKPRPAAGDQADVGESTEVQLPTQAAAYQAPQDLPARTAHDTFEMQTVALAAVTDPRKATTEPKLKSPVVEKDTIPDLVRREPTLRGLHAGAPGADEAPPSTGFTAVVVPPVAAPPEDPGFAAPAPAGPPRRRGTGKLGWVLAAAAVVLVIGAAALRTRSPERTVAAPSVTATPGTAMSVRSVESAPTAAPSSAPSNPAQRPPTVAESQRPEAPRPTAKPKPPPSGASGPGAKPAGTSDPDNPML